MLVRIDATGSLIRCWRGCKMVQTLWESIWQFLINLQIYTWASIPTPGFVPQRSHHWSSPAHLYRNVFADRYTITEQWKQPGTIEQADGLTSWDGTTLLSNKNGWAIESCKQVHLRGGVLGEKSQPEKNTDQMTPFIQHLCKGSMMVMENWAVVARGAMRGGVRAFWGWRHHPGCSALHRSTHTLKFTELYTK